MKEPIVKSKHGGTDMGRKLAMDNISLISKDGFAHTEYSLDYHETLKKKFNVRLDINGISRNGK